MSILWAVLSVFVLAALAPFVAPRLKRASGWVLALLPASLFVYFLQYVPIVAEGTPVQHVHAWVPGLDVSLSFYLDGLALFFALLVTGVGTLIVIYSGGYMQGTEHFGRFFGQLLFFMGSMLGLVVADNIMAFFIFFELTSLASYLLIGFYHTDDDARRSARKALVVTGGGGLALMAGLLLLAQVTGTMAFSEMLDQGSVVTASPLYGPILVLVLAGAFTKSAQFPFHFWLPAAMAGPTPVSAYLHSATMVKAGVFLLARLFPVLGGTTAWTAILVPVGGFTMLLTAWLALHYTDLKQILAYTTVMVLGLLTMLLGVGTTAAVEAAVVFTLVHALYKGALFMIAGNVDHETGTRDVNKLGGLRASMPITMIGGLAAALSMSGLPPFFGFIGKEVTYEAALHAGGLGYAVLALGVLANAALFAAGLVVGIKPFFGEARSEFTRHPHEAPASMWVGPLVLAGLGLTFGLVPGFVDEMVLQPALEGIMQESHSVHLELWHGLSTALLFSLVTFAIGGLLYAAWTRLQPSAFMGALSHWLGDGPARGFERGLYGLARGGYHSSRILQNGLMRRYLLVIFSTIAIVTGFFFFSGQSLSWPGGLGDVQFFEATLAALVVLAAAVAVRARDRFVAILGLAVAGYSIALIYLLYGAPDLAMTQFAIETLTAVLLALVLISLPRSVFQESMGGRVRDAVASVAVGVMMTLIMLTVLTRPLDRRLSDFLAEHSYIDAHGHNIVNVILVDFRGVDTLGEITVLTMVGLGVYALMRARPKPTAS